MAAGENKLFRRRLVGSWISTVISISLVLLLVGIAALLLVNARSVSDYFKENMQVSVLMTPDVDEEAAAKFQAELVVSCKVDPNQIGGLVVRVGDTIYDGSIASQLENMRRNIVKNYAPKQN